MKKGVLIGRFNTKRSAKDIIEMKNKDLALDVLYYVWCWIDGAFPYAIIKIVDVEGED